MMDQTNPKVDAFDALVEAIAERVAAKLGPAAPRYFSTAEPGPYGTARAFADAARRGDFPSFIVSRRLTAKAADVFDAIERSPVDRTPKRTPKTANDTDDRDVLESMGVRLRSAAGGR